MKKNDSQDEDGSVVWTRWECRPWHEADGSIGGIIVYTEVITERKNAEIELRQTKEYLEKLIRYANAPIVVWNENFEITMKNFIQKYLKRWLKMKILTPA